MFSISPIIWTDSLLYFDEAQSILETGGFKYHHIFHAPGYPILLALCIKLNAAHAGLLAVIIQRVFGILTSLLVYTTARRLFSSHVAFGAALLISLCPLLLLYETAIGTEMLFLFTLTALLSIAVIAVQSERWQFLPLLGFLLGVSSLVRPLAQYLFILPLGLILWRCPVSSSRWQRAALVIGAYLIAVLPWMYVNRVTYGFFGVSKGQGINLFYRVYDLDRVSPPKETSYPQVKEEHLRQLSLRTPGHHRSAYFDVRTALHLRHGMHALEVDNALLGYAFEGVRSETIHYLSRSLLGIIRLLVWPNPTLDPCEKPSGPDICAPYVPERKFSGLVDDSLLLSSWIILGHLPLVMLALSGGYEAVTAVLAIMGLILYFRSHGSNDVLGLLFLGTVLYFLLLTALFNSPDDRYRLVIDPMFAIFSASVPEAWKKWWQA